MSLVSVFEVSAHGCCEPVVRLNMVQKTEREQLTLGTLSPAVRDFGRVMLTEDVLYSFLLWNIV